MECLVTAAAVSMLIEPHRSLVWGSLWNSHVVIYGPAACVVLPRVRVFAVVWIYMSAEKVAACCSPPARHGRYPPGNSTCMWQRFSHLHSGLINFTRDVTRGGSFCFAHQLWIHTGSSASPRQSSSARVINIDSISLGQKWWSQYVTQCLIFSHTFSLWFLDRFFLKLITLH